MPRKPKFRPVIMSVKLNPEQAVLSCTCYDVGWVFGATTFWAEAFPVGCSGGRSSVSWGVGCSGAGPHGYGHRLDVSLLLSPFARPTFSKVKQ